jgi:hypothetical protein
MTDGVDLLGPVDWIVVELPGSWFNGEVASASRPSRPRLRPCSSSAQPSYSATPRPPEPCRAG